MRGSVAREEMWCDGVAERKTSVFEIHTGCFSSHDSVHTQVLVTLGSCFDLT